jgi:hypothetical protein
MENDGIHGRVVPGKTWLRIPDGTKVKHRLDGYEGTIDGLTAIVVRGASLNPDRKTQYRINVGTPYRNLAAEEDLLIRLDPEGLVMMGKEKVEYRRQLTERLRGALKEDRFTT